jgi:hypothetical protein
MADDPYIKSIRKDHVVATDADADWDGTSSEWFALDGTHPIKGLLITSLAAGDLTIQVSDTSAGTTAYELGVAESLVAKSGSVAIFVPELAPFTYARVTSTASQTDVTIRLVRTS